jgi:hypothetical protein
LRFRASSASQRPPAAWTFEEMTTWEWGVGGAAGVLLEDPGGDALGVDDHHLPVDRAPRDRLRVDERDHRGDGGVVRFEDLLLDRSWCDRPQNRDRLRGRARQVEPAG